MTDHFARAGSAASSPGDARDLRNLLEAVADALTLPYDTDDYEKRLVDRAGWALAVIRGALDEDPADIGWNADYLRSRMAPKQAATDRAEPGEGR
ncbi:hypothetical protein [Streptomyces sp. KR55]|uniref:hypothetical protein n=1 Tax=Streptomyces sp. KR55 TaxID=3457425 RepID=UPI003FD04B45